MTEMRITTYSCTPVSWFSSNFILKGAGHTAHLNFNWFGEQGTSLIDGIDCSIRKQGFFSPTWTLELGGQPIATAAKPSFFSANHTIEAPTGQLTLRRWGFFTTAMVLESEAGKIATIKPASGFFTRAFVVEVTHLDLDFPILAFACWIRLMLHRRNQQNNSSG